MNVLALLLRGARASRKAAVLLQIDFAIGVPVALNLEIIEFWSAKKKFVEIHFERGRFISVIPAKAGIHIRRGPGPSPG
jgi:hypothetical protein